MDVFGGRKKSQSVCTSNHQHLYFKHLEILFIILKIKSYSFAINLQYYKILEDL